MDEVWILQLGRTVLSFCVGGLREVAVANWHQCPQLRFQLFYLAVFFLLAVVHFMLAADFWFMTDPQEVL